MNYFKSNYNLTKDEVTALMGAHTLGGCKPEKSGYNGNWTNGEEIYFNQKFYQYILGSEDDAPTQLNINNKRMKPNSKSDKKWQWNLYNSTGDLRGIMLNTDIELAYNVDVDKLKGTKCVNGNHGPGNPCARSDSFEKVESYAKCFRMGTCGGKITERS